MFRFISGFFRILVALVLFLTSMFSFSLLIVVIGSIGFLFPVKGFQKFCKKMMVVIGEGWISFCAFVLRLTSPVKWDIQWVGDINPHKSYLVIANHQSYMDIPVLYSVVNRKIPLLRYFMKKQLQHVPVWGWACWMLDFPRMYRYNQATLAKYPALKGKDIEMTRKACRNLRDEIFALANFVEGTRFTEEKQIEKKSPYKYLLPPKTGGIAYALAVLGDHIETVLNVTIIYEGEKIVSWKFFTGDIRKVIVRVEPLLITKDLRGDYEKDVNFRKTIQQWMNELWHRKDYLIDSVLSTSDGTTVFSSNLR